MIENFDEKSSIDSPTANRRMWEIEREKEKEAKKVKKEKRSKEMK